MTAPTLREAAQSALDALCMPCDRWNGTQARIVNAAIDALRSALAAQPAPDEQPVAREQIFAAGRASVTIDEMRARIAAFDAAPIAQQAAPARQPLTVDQIEAMNRAAQDQGIRGVMPWLYLARAIEAAHGIK